MEKDHKLLCVDDDVHQSAYRGMPCLYGGKDKDGNHIVRISKAKSIVLKDMSGFKDFDQKNYDVYRAEKAIAEVFKDFGYENPSDHLTPISQTAHLIVYGAPF